jgi:hypothetical protein
VDPGHRLRYWCRVDKPFGLINDAFLALKGLPRFTSTSNVYKGRLRVQRAF